MVRNVIDNQQANDRTYCWYGLHCISLELLIAVELHAGYYSIVASLVNKQVLISHSEIL